MQPDQSIVKSIIYGNPIQTTYGLFRSLCSAINQKDHIDKIIFYLRNNQNFRKYNKFVYAFRLEQTNSQTFITTDINTHPQKQKYIEGYNDDMGLQGNGEKLLNLLKKFSVRNVLVIVAIRQKDPLKQFNSEHYVLIVKCAKDLLSSLYDKVILAKDEAMQMKGGSLVYEPLPVKQFNIPIQTFYPTVKKRQNPNYVGQNFVKKVEDRKANTNKLQVEMTYLNAKIQQLANQLQDTIEEFVNIEDSQIQFAILYDKTPYAVKSFSMLAELFGLKNKQELIVEINRPEYYVTDSKGSMSRMANYLKSITTRTLNSNKIRKMNQELLSNKSLKSEKIKAQNPMNYFIMLFIEILLKSYSFARRLAIIEAQIEGDQPQEDGEGDQNSSQISDKPEHFGITTKKKLLEKKQKEVDDDEDDDSFL